MSATLHHIDPVIPFGRHKGRRLSRVADESPAYLNWMLEGMGTPHLFVTAHRPLIQALLARREGATMQDDKPLQSDQEAAVEGILHALLDLELPAARLDGGAGVASAARPWRLRPG